MKKLLLFSIVPFIFSCTQMKPDYPATRKDNTIDTYFGTEVSDPYRWLEDDMSEETAEWVTAQNEVTFGYLEQIPFRDRIRDRLKDLWNYSRMGTPYQKGGYYFYTYNDGLQNQDVIYKTTDIGEKGSLFLDPNTLSEDGTVALSTYSFSNDGKYMGYGIARAGSDWNEFFVKEVESGITLADHLEWIKFSDMAWYRDGFFYSRYEEPVGESALSGINKNNRLYYHKAGTEQSDDKLIYEDTEHPDNMYYAQVTEDEKFLVISVMQTTTGNGVFIAEPGAEKPKIRKMVDNFDHEYFLVGSSNGLLYFLTNLDAPMYRLIAVDPQKLEQENWIEILPENPSQVLRSCGFAGGRIISLYEKDARSLVNIYSMDGELISELELPGIGTVAGLSSKLKSDEAFYAYTSFDTPTEVYRVDMKDLTSSLIFRPEVDFDTDAYVTQQVFFTSKDGTKVPMFIVHRKDQKPDGKRPTLLYGYGGFNITRTPAFSITNLIWLENGGVYALANIRGGGEYGESWHQAGTLQNKQNVFDDFIAAGEYLVENNYTSPERLAIFGGSNGGLLVGAVTNQRPDLFAVALPNVGVMDMLRFHKFTIGRYWVSDYGSSENEEQFHYLYGYSPLHNIREDIDYPAVLVTTGDHDDRVVPAHSFKYIATLQEKYKGNNPVLIRIETDAGHGAGKPVDKVIEEYADRWAFAFYNMDFEPNY